MYLDLQQRLAGHIRNVLREKYQIEVENIPISIPPELKFGELATPIAFELARKLRKAPKAIAQEMVVALGTVEGFEGFEIAGAGYINARFDRAKSVHAIAFGEGSPLPAPGHSLVEHTSINPNKAATSATCAMPFLATRLCACCARRGRRSRPT